MSTARPAVFTVNPSISEFFAGSTDINATSRVALPDDLWLNGCRRDHELAGKTFFSILRDFASREIIFTGIATQPTRIEAGS